MKKRCPKIELTILGSGTCMPSLKRSSCSFLLDIYGEKLLFDTGAGTIRRLLEAGVSIEDIGYIFYSHFHPDHTGELVSFLFSSKYSEDCERKKPLNIIAGKGFDRFFNGLKSVYGSWIELAEPVLNIMELDNKGYDSAEFKEFRVESAPVDHNEESIAYRIITLPGRKSIVYSGDTDYSENLISISKNADLLICESAFPDELKTKGHMTPGLAGEIATRANVRKLVLTHFYPECDKADIFSQCRKTYKGPLLLAEDLMKIYFD